MLDIIYKCRDYAVIFKPRGMLSEGEVPAALAEALAEEGTPPESVYTVHRLDRGTEGLMVYALHRTAAVLLSQIISGGELEKEYTALVTLEGELPERGEMRDYLYFDRRRDKSFIADRARRGAKEAVLTYEITERGTYKNRACAAVRIKLGTGRTHQIRVQFGARKAPLLGDGKYGSRVNFKFAALRCTCLRFPWNGETVEYRANGPEMGFMSDEI